VAVGAGQRVVVGGGWRGPTSGGGSLARANNDEDGNETSAPRTTAPTSRSTTDLATNPSPTLASIRQPPTSPNNTRTSPRTERPRARNDKAHHAALLRPAIEAGSSRFSPEPRTPPVRSTMNSRTQPPCTGVRLVRGHDDACSVIGGCVALWLAGAGEPPLGLGVKAALADSALRGLDSGRAAAGAATMGGLQPPVCETSSIESRSGASSPLCRAVTVVSRIATPPRPPRPLAEHHVQRQERRSGTAVWVTSREQTWVTSRER
jgi:hypothetical protein